MGQGEGDPRCTTTAGTAPSSRTRGPASCGASCAARSEEHTSELQSQSNLVCRLLLEKKHVAYLPGSDERDAVARHASNDALRDLRQEARVVGAVLQRHPHWVFRKPAE